MIEPNRPGSVISVFAADNEWIVVAANVDKPAFRADRNAMRSARRQAGADGVDRHQRPGGGTKESRADVWQMYRRLLEFGLIVFLRRKVGRLADHREVAVETE